MHTLMYWFGVGTVAAVVIVSAGYFILKEQLGVANWSLITAGFAAIVAFLLYPGKHLPSSRSAGYGEPGAVYGEIAAREVQGFAHNEPVNKQREPRFSIWNILPPLVAAAILFFFIR